MSRDDLPSSISTSLLASLLGKAPANVHPYRPFVPAGNRQAWQALPPEVQTALGAAAQDCSQPLWPPLPMSLYRDFFRTGNRIHFETPYFARRRNLSSLVLAECVTHDGRHMDDIIDGIYALCGEVAWQLPAHNSYVRDTPQLEFPHPEEPVLDLFACETGAILATTLYLLRSELHEINPAVPTLMIQTLKQRIIVPYLTAHFWWMGPEPEKKLNNWTPWCTQNVLLTAAFLAQEDGVITPETMRTILDKATTSLDYFLDEYGDDGCCTEGAQYYRHATLCLFTALDILTVLGGWDARPLWQHQKLRNMALYMYHVHVHGPWYINFADCSPLPGPCGAREFSAALKIGSAELASLAALDRQSRPPAPPWEENNLFHRLQDIFLYKDMKHHADTAGTTSEDILKQDIFYPSTGLFITRDRSFCVAVKGGDNADSHNHNDVGSITVYKDGKPLLIDLGVETYTRKTFSPQRYEIWTMQSSWHNLPSFGEVMQSDGATYRAQDITVHSSDTVSSISMDIAQAYPQDAHVESYRRTLTLEKNSSLVMTDVHKGLIAPTLNLMFSREPVCTPDGIIVDGTHITIEVDNLQMSQEKIPITDSRLAPAWSPYVWRVRIPFTDTLTMRIL